jgi:hypothetical protein
VPLSWVQEREGQKGEPGSSLEVIISVRANLYRPARKKIQVQSSKGSSVNFLLNRKPSKEVGVIRGRVIDSRIVKGIAGVVVSIRNAGGDLSTTTNPEGSYTIRGVGFARDLHLQVVTNVPPCFVPAERNFTMTHADVLQNFSLDQIFTQALHCPLETPRRAKNPTVSPALPDDSSVQWKQADVLAIQGNVDPDTWHAGHVNDILKLDDGSLLVATDTGGVWAITSQQQAIFLSGSWASVDMTSLAFGPDGPQHLYAGTYQSAESPGGALFETDTSALAPQFSWRPVNPSPPCVSIWRILVDAGARRIILACTNSGGQAGIWWSQIPPAPSAQGTYQWVPATPGPGVSSLQLQRIFSGLAFGPTTSGGQRTIVASDWGGSAPSDIIFYGGWSNGNLVLNLASVGAGSGIFFTGRTSVAGCAQDPTLMYAVAADGFDATIGGVWKSKDGGQNWAPVSSPPGGNQGGYNNTIAVKPDCSAVVVGWENGTFVSYDGGGSWTQLQDPIGGYSDLHADIHALTFDPAHWDNLYIGSDGGVASAFGIVQGTTPTFRSDYNHLLFNMQLYHVAGSSQSSGLVAAGLQDNGVLFASLPGPWQHLTDCHCDGLISAFVTPPGLGPGTSILLDGENAGPWFPWNSIESQPNGFPFNSQQTIPVATSQNPRDPQGIADGPPGVVSVVNPPLYRNNAGQLMYAITGLKTNVYGLFANDDGSDIHWEMIGMVGGGQNVFAVSSSDGNSVFIGTDQGILYRLDSPYPASAFLLPLSFPPAFGAGQINAILEVSSVVAFAALQVGGNGYLLAWDGQIWNPLVTGSLPNNLPFTSLEARLGSLFAATRTGVYVTHDGGKTWFTASDGLPTVSQGMDLHVVYDLNGTHYLYLATYGWSLWRAVLR